MGPKNGVGVRELNLFYTFFVRFYFPNPKKGEGKFSTKKKITECSRFCLRRYRKSYIGN